MVVCQKCGREYTPTILSPSCPYCSAYYSSEPACYTSSGITTTATFSDIVDIFQKPTDTVSVKELKEKKVWFDGVKVLSSLGYLRKSNDEYELTKKGVKAYFENKAFRAEVKKILKEKYGME